MPKKTFSLWLLHEFLRKFMRCSLVSHAARRAALTAARIPLASSLVYEPVLTQFTSITPACFSHVHDPKRFVNTLQKPENELRKMRHFPTGKPLSALHPVWQRNF